MWRGARAAVLLLLGLGLQAPQGSAVKVRLQARANPIRKVVNMLQAMQKKVEDEGKREAELFDAFMCYCKTGGGELSASISDAETKGPALTSGIEAGVGKLAQSKEDLKGAQTGRAQAKADVQEAMAIREKEAGSYAKEKAESDTNIAAMEKAVAALERGMEGGFLQTGSAKVLRRLAQAADSDLLDDSDRQQLVAFLSGTAAEGSDYAPQSGEVVGILKQMHETMVKSLADATVDEEAAIKSHAELVSAKAKEIEAQTATVEAKTKQIGELGVEIVQMKEDLTDTAATLSADKEFLSNLDTSCEKKKAEWAERSKTRAEEVVALADTIKVLNDDDALDLFKKALPGASSSFLQVAVTSREMRARAVRVIREARHKAASRDKAGLDMLVLALAGKKALGQGAFGEVVGMVDRMVAVLKKEQVDDDDKKEYCNAQIDQAEDTNKALQRTIEEETNAIATSKEAIATLSEEIASLSTGIKELDASVSEATSQRKKENEEYKELMASNGAAKELLSFAKNRLQKFYNPKLYKAAPKRELSAEDRIASGVSGTEPPTEAPGGIADTGIAAFVQVAARSRSDRAPPSPPPATWDAYTKKSEENTGVVAMIDLLIKDVDKDMTEADVDEKDSQADYETMMKESAAKRTADSKSLTEKEGAKADIESELQAHEEVKASTKKEFYATVKFLGSIHQECDWLLNYYDTRKTARADEVDSLNKAKAVLSGADYSLVQTGAVRRHLRHRAAL